MQMPQAGTSTAEELNEAHKRVDHYGAWALDAEVKAVLGFEDSGVGSGLMVVEQHPLVQCVFSMCLISCKRETVSGKSVTGRGIRLRLQARSMLQELGCQDVHAKVSSLSGGQRRRAALAAALMSAPDLLVLDEPTNHLDLQVRLYHIRSMSAPIPVCSTIARALFLHHTASALAPTAFVRLSQAFSSLDAPLCAPSLRIHRHM